MTNVNRYHCDEGGKTEFARQGKGNEQVHKSIKKKQTDRYRQMNGYGYGYGQRKILKKGGKGERMEGGRKEEREKERKEGRKEGREKETKEERNKKRKN